MSKYHLKAGKLLLTGLIMLFIFNIEAYGQNVTGTVVDETNTPLPGVSVMVKNTQTAALTDLNGNYQIKADNIQSDVLIFTFIGMENQEVAIEGRTQINVTMQVSATVLGEVVAIGYGTAKKKDITGSVSSVQGKDLALIPVSTAAEAMTGKMAGVQVVTTEGSPDAQINIRVRGGGSITQDNSPLYIVDNFPVSSISDIPASEIQSIDVLKDASSTAIYGARGANGVIIITTKGGIEGKVKVNYNAYYGLKKVANQLKSISVQDYVRWQYEYALLADGGSASSTNLRNYERIFGTYQDIDLFNNQPGTNWFDQVFGHIGNAFNQDLSVTGGSDKFRYSFSYANLKSDEIMLGSEYKRDNLALKLDHKASKSVDLSFSLRYSDTKIYGAGTVEQTGATPNDARVKQTMIFWPVPYTAIADYEYDELGGSMVQPLDAVADNDRLQFRKRYNMGASFNWKITEDLVFRTEAGLDYYVNNDNRFYGLSTYYVKNTPAASYQNMPALEVTDNKGIGFRNTNILNYDFKKVFSGTAHSLKILLGQETLKTESNTIFNQVWGLPTFFTSDQAYKLVSQGFSNRYLNTYNPDNKLVSFFGRANYDFKGRYILSATFRADGSSKFAQGNRWGYFPSAAVAWRISEEGFMQGITSTLDNLKIRLSYGTAGNNNIPANQIAQIFTAGTSAWINGASTFWSPTSVMANPDLKWETTYTRNAGLDFGLFKSKISGSVEVYYNTTKDLLIEFPVSGSGYQTQYRNMGETENKGTELTLNFVALDKKDYGLNFGFNIGFNKNKIVSLGVMDDFGMNSSWASTEIQNDYWVAVGGSVGEMYGYQSDGRYEVGDFEGYDAVNNIWILKEGIPENTLIGTIRPGSIKLKDITNDTIVDIHDVSVIGNANPKHTGGMNINARFYGFDLSAVFSWSYGNNIYNANKIEYTTGRYPFRNMIDIMAEGERWNNINESGEIVNDPVLLEQMNQNTTMWSPYMTRHLFTDWAVEDGSFLRLNTLSLGYTVPSEIMKRVRIQSLRFYVSCYNVFILTKYSGFDPEVSSRRNTGLTPGLDYSAYPKSRQLLFGLNLSF
jgi:TonB-dependent starch-binding outer membrane protein SusC